MKKGVSDEPGSVILRKRQRVILRARRRVIILFKLAETFISFTTHLPKEKENLLTNVSLFRGFLGREANPLL